MNLNHREPCRITLKAAIPERLPSAELVRQKPAQKRGQVDQPDTDDHTICLEKIVLNSDLDFF